MSHPSDPACIALAKTGTPSARSGSLQRAFNPNRS